MDCYLYDKFYSLCSFLFFNNKNACFKGDSVKYTDNFEKLWALYPRKTNKYQASVKYESLVRRRPKEVEILLDYIKTQKWPEAQFIPHLSTVINQKRFLDPEVTFIDDKQKRIKADVDKTYKNQQKEIKERFEVKEKTIEEMAELIKKDCNHDFSKESLEKRIRKYLAVGKNAPDGSPLWNFRKKTAQALVLVFGKQSYLDVWEKIHEKPVKENRISVLNEQKKKLLNLT